MNARRAAIPPTADPAVRRVLELTRGIKAKRSLEAATGLGDGTIHRWQYCRNQHIATVRRALQGLGLDLAVVPLVGAPAIARQPTPTAPSRWTPAQLERRRLRLAEDGIEA